MCCDSLGSCCLLSSLASRAHTVGQVDYTDLASVAGSCSSVSDYLTLMTFSFSGTISTASSMIHFSVQRCTGRDQALEKTDGSII